MCLAVMIRTQCDNVRSGVAPALAERNDVVGLEKDGAIVKNKSEIATPLAPAAGARQRPISDR